MMQEEKIAQLKKELSQAIAKLLERKPMDLDDFSSIQARMADLNTLRGLWNQAARFREDRQRMAEIYSEEQTRADGQLITEETSSFLFELSDLYIKASSEQRDTIRRMLGENKRILPTMLNLIGEAEYRLAQTGDRAWLHRGLAIASMEDWRGIDYRDTYLVLCSLCTTAQEHGIDTAPYFQRGELGEFALDASKKTGHAIVFPSSFPPHRGIRVPNWNEKLE